jgi:hypothetical protein
MTPIARIADIAEILAAGLIRLLGKMSSQKSRAGGESSLDIMPDQSGHPTPADRRMEDA